MVKGDRLEQKSSRALEPPPVDWERIIAGAHFGAIGDRSSAGKQV
jgi:hypothetical protein